MLTSDPETTRLAARGVLRQVLSCRDGMTDSGIVARIAGDAIGANEYLPNMATDDFLKCLSKTAMERAATALSVLPRQTGKATRAALIEHVGQATYILPAARFALSPADLARLEAETSERPAYGSAEDDQGENPDIEGVDDGSFEAGPDAGDDGADGDADQDSIALPPPSVDGAGLDALAA